jgi:decaprenylphospho-beta-D-ribofuranose 2-oxidase
MKQRWPGSDDDAREVVQGYGGRHQARAQVVRPESVRELREILSRAAREGRSVTVRGGGQSIDDRAVGGDLVVSTARLDFIEVDAGASRLTVGPGATWGAILNRLPRGLVPHVVVTTSAATAGGTLSADCISRFSRCFGRESRHVVRFDLLTVGDRILTCEPEGENRDVFAAVTAGLGFVGVIVSITYALLDLRALIDGRPKDQELRVETRARMHRGFEATVADLLAPPTWPGEPEAVYAILGLNGRGVVHRTRYVAGGEDLPPQPIAQRPGPVRMVGEWLMWRGAINRAAWAFGFSVFYGLRRHFLDDVFGWTFVMDGNARAVSLARRLGGEVYVLQQTFVIPGSPATAGASAARTAEFMRDASRQLEAGGFVPTLFDVLYLPPDPGRDEGGLAVTVAFILFDRARVDGLSACLCELSARCRQLGGHVHMVKDVHAHPEDLAAMHGARLEQLVTVRARLDPRGVLRNDFLDRVVTAAARAAGRADRRSAAPAGPAGA